MIEIDTKTLLEAAHVAERNVGVTSSAGSAQNAFRRSLRTIAGRLRLASLALSAMLVLVGIAVALAFFQLTTRNEQGRVLGEGSLAAAELTASIADSRYYASRYAATGTREEITRAQATLAEAKRRLAATRALAAENDQTTTEAIDWLQVQVDGFESELTALANAIARTVLRRAGTPSPTRSISAASSSPTTRAMSNSGWPRSPPGTPPRSAGSTSRFRWS